MQEEWVNITGIYTIKLSSRLKLKISLENREKRRLGKIRLDEISRAKATWEKKLKDQNK